MDPRQHDLAGAAPHEPFDFPDRVFRVPAPDPPPDVRDDAVGAELAAPVLDLHVRPRMAVQRAEAQRAAELISTIQADAGASAEEL